MAQKMRSTPLTARDEETSAVDEESLLLLNHHGSLEVVEDSLHYEELINPSKNSVTCRTCSGLGRVPKERTNELLVLVPYNDERLQPKRTKCIVTTSVIITIAIFS